MKSPDYEGLVILLEMICDTDKMQKSEQGRWKTTCSGDCNFEKVVFHQFLCIDFTGKYLIL